MDGSHRKMDNEQLLESLMRQVLSSVEGLKAQISTIQVDQAKLQGDFSTRLLEQHTVFDTKLLALERSFDQKMQRREEKVDGWFDEMQKTLEVYKISMEGRITTVSVKIGLIFAISSVVIATIVGVIIRALMAASSAAQ